MTCIPHCKNHFSRLSNAHQIQSPHITGTGTINAKAVPRHVDTDTPAVTGDGNFGFHASDVEMTIPVTCVKNRPVGRRLPSASNVARIKLGYNRLALRTFIRLSLPSKVKSPALKVTPPFVDD